MKAKTTLILVFLIGMVGTAQPALLYGGETGGGNIWDIFVDKSPFTGTKFSGTLSIYYDPIGVTCGTNSEGFLATMYYTVRLNKGFQLYTFQGSTPEICSVDIAGQGYVIFDVFLDNAIHDPRLYPNVIDWKLKSIDNAQYHFTESPPLSLAFVADIVIAVKE